MAKRRGLWLVVAMMLGAVGARGQGLKAGAARVEITPPPGLALWGYSNRAGGAQGTLDPLAARTLVLADERAAVAIVALDLGRTFGPAQIAALRARVQREHGVSGIMLVASHTHSGPSIDDEYEGGRVPEWERTALDRIAASIGEARARAVPARVGVGMGQAQIGHNRRLVQSNGRVRMLWRNSTGQPTGVIDPSVGVIRIDDEAGRPIAILVNYACHPVVFGPDNLRYSADYPGAMARLVEESWGGGAVCLFLQGAPGDINPLLDKTPLAENAVELMRRVGEELGREALRVSRAIATFKASAPSIALFSEEMTFANRWDAARLRDRLENYVGPAAAVRYRRYIVERIQMPVTTLVLNQQIALVGLPGEPFVGLQLSLKRRSPLAATFLCGYTNGYYGYFPTIGEAISGGYGASTVTTRVEVGAGERMVDRGLIQIYRALGRLKDVPERAP